VAHFKGHELSGFGGTIKNLGMGCASRKGKLAQHSSVSPRVSQDKCVGCGDCVMHCSQSALELVERAPVDASRASAGANGRKNAVIDAERCIGCGECILICPNGAIDIAWNQSIPVFLENMVEYTLGVLKGKSKKSIFLNFLTDVSPACDCCSHNDSPIVRDIGVLAARDPVAIDQAAVDLVNQQPALADCCLTANRAPGEDKFSGLYPDVDWKIQLDYAQLLGLGRRDYRLEKI
jgi:uncharacterized Fe-S center protein